MLTVLLTNWRQEWEVGLSTWLESEGGCLEGKSGKLLLVLLNSLQDCDGVVLGGFWGGGGTPR